eukprot:13933870-Alexandrium_andersonii.AAC.1
MLKCTCDEVVTIGNIGTLLRGEFPEMWNAEGGDTGQQGQDPEVQVVEPERVLPDLGWVRQLCRRALP